MNLSIRFFIILAFALLLSTGLESDAELELFDKARVLYNEAKFIEAIDVFQEIIKNNPHNIEAYLNLAHLYKDLAKYGYATKIISDALKYSDDIRLKLLLGRLHYLNGNSRQAIFQLRQLLPFYSEEPEFWLHLGLCYEDFGKLDEAERYYLDVIKLKPDNVLAYLRLGNIYYHKEEPQKAVEAYQEVIALDPSIPEVRARLAGCFTELGKFAQAYKEYAKCIAIEPEDEYLQKRLEETKTKLGKDFFQKRKELVSWRRRKKSIQVKPSPFAEIASQVRVGITRVEDSVEFKCGNFFEIIDKQSGERLFKGNKESIYSLLFNENTNIQLKDNKDRLLLTGLDKPFLIKNSPEDSVITFFDLSSGKGSFWAGWNDQQYRGAIEVSPDSSGFQLINLVNLEEYLYGVLPSEMPVDWPEQALRAQAIAARTWAVKNKARHKREGFNFCNTVHCQVYKGAQAERPSTNEAVDATGGLILLSGDQPIDIFYSNNCGGCTQEGVTDAPSLDFRFPLSPLELEEWLKRRPPTFCNLKSERAANFRWVRLYRQEQLETMLSRAGIDVGELLRIIPQRRTNSGHLISIEVKGTKSSRVIDGENNIRKALGDLLSSAFKIETKFNQLSFPEEFILYGGGFGHGRGLCQTGIKGMALQGYDCPEILRHYYPDTEIKRIY